MPTSDGAPLLSTAMVQAMMQAEHAEQLDQLEVWLRRSVICLTYQQWQSSSTHEKFLRMIINQLKATGQPAERQPVQGHLSIEWMPSPWYEGKKAPGD